MVPKPKASQKTPKSPKRRRGKTKKLKLHQTPTNLRNEWLSFVKHNQFATGYYVSRRKSFYKKRKIYVPKFNLKVLKPGREAHKTYFYLRSVYYKSRRRKNFKRLAPSNYLFVKKELTAGKGSIFSKKKKKKYNNITDAQMKECFKGFIRK